MTNARPFSISTLQDLSNDTKNTSMQGVLVSAIELQTFRSLGGLQIPNFGSGSFILPLHPKWGCDNNGSSNSNMYNKSLNKSMIFKHVPILKGLIVSTVTKGCLFGSVPTMDGDAPIALLLVPISTYIKLGGSYLKSRKVV